MRHNVSFATPDGFCFDTGEDCAGCDSFAGLREIAGITGSNVVIGAYAPLLGI
jgi:hypothetical protein